MYTQNKRLLRNYILVNPRYQLRYVFWITLLGVVIIFTYSAAFYNMVHQNVVALGGGIELIEHLRSVLWTLISSALAFTIAIASVVMILSHRTAGMLFHFKKVIDGIKEGDMSLRMQSRSRDDFSDVAQAFNEMMDSLQNRRG